MADCEPERRIRLERGDGCWRGIFRAMASPCEVLVECESAAQARHLAELAATESWRIEDKFSRYRPGNAVDRINAAGGEAIEVDDEIAAMLDFAGTLYSLSGGRFDVTSGVLREVWRFDGGDAVPSDEAVERVLGRVGWNRVDWKRPVLRMQPGMQVDFGGIGKEYAVDRASQLLHDASDGSALVNLGGDLALSRGPRGRAAWRVGIESVTAGGGVAEKVIDLAAGAIATSGDARRYVLRDGIRYGHILDPTTGKPVGGAPRSVTVAADTCTQAGMLSTLAMLEGPEAESFLDHEGVRYWCWR